MNIKTFFGQQSCYAFCPVYSGEQKYTVCISIFPKRSGKKENPEIEWEEAISIDDCLQIAIWRLIPFSSNRALSVVIFDDDNQEVRTYVNTDQIIKDIWKSVSNIPFSEGEKDELLDQDWFLFSKTTPREEIWHWFDVHYKEGVASLLYGRED